MATRSETGHGKNAANFENLITFCASYGLGYNPSKVAIRLPGLYTLLTNANAALQAVKVAKTAYDNAIKAREFAFKPLKPLATKIIDTLSSMDVTSQTIYNAKSTNTKIQGKRVKAIKEPERSGVDSAVAPIKKAPTSQRSYDKLIDHLAQFIQTLTAEEKYVPNENELKVATLNILLVDLKAKNTSVINATTALSNARIARDKSMYYFDMGLIDIARDVKQYVKSHFGASSPQYKQIRGLEFKDIKGD